RPGPARGGDRDVDRRAARQLPAGLQPHRADHGRVRDRQGARRRVIEASRKRLTALESAGPFQTSDPADVRWLLCGRGRPLAGGERRAPVHRHPLPTEALLGRFALLAATAERDGLYVSMTRVVSFGPAPEELRERVWAAAQVDGAVLAASQPGATVGGLFDVLRAAYGKLGLRDEWRLHHQGGLTGYAGREVFAAPGD